MNVERHHQSSLLRGQLPSGGDAPAWALTARLLLALYCRACLTGLAVWYTDRLVSNTQRG